MKNILGRPIPEFIPGYGATTPFMGVQQTRQVQTAGTTVTTHGSTSKIVKTIEDVLDRVDIRDGMTISFHHHLRNGDYVLNMVMDAIAKKGIRDLTIAASSLFPVHEPLVAYIEAGIVTKIVTGYVSGPVANAISTGKLKYPAVLMTHGGRPRAIEECSLPIDIAFVAAPCTDPLGNLNGVQGPSACGTLGYAVADCHYANHVVVITDHVVPYPACPIDISQIYIDYIVPVACIGDPKGIVAGTTKITKDPVGLNIAATTAQLIQHSGYFKDGMSFQTGAGGVSLAVAVALQELMQQAQIKGSFASGGITSYIVQMLEEGLFDTLFDTQCFDLDAVNSYRNNPRHQFMSCSMYANPNRKGNVADQLDVMILGATEIDVDFNVNVITGSDGFIMGGSGGHSDTAAGAKLAIVVTNLIRSRLPIVKDAVTTVTTPGETIDVLVTEYGVAIHPKRTDLIEKIQQTNIPLYTIQQLKDLAESITGKPEPLQFEDQIVAVVEYRDGTVIDVVRKPK